MDLEDKIIGGLKNIYGYFRFAAHLPRNLKTIRSIPARKSFYPEYPRKSDRQIKRENRRYLLKNKEVNPYYISYGFDAEGFRRQEEFLTHRDFFMSRDRGNQAMKRTPTGDYNYIALLRDKYLFFHYLASALGPETVVPVYALISQNRSYYVEKSHWAPLEQLLSEEGEKVYKVLDGECADGVMLVENRKGMLRVDGEEKSREDFLASIRGSRLIVQHIVRQHEALSCFQTKSISTVRVITVRGKSGAIELFAAFLRLSADADSFVDNRARGGLGIGVDLETGKLMRYGFPHDSFGCKLEVHPLSGIVFEGFQLPDWEAVRQLVIRAHEQFYTLQSIGWDVVLTPAGPRLLEGNDDWEICGPQDTNGGLKTRWKELING